MSGITKVCELEGRSCYHDPSMEVGKVLVMSKGAEVKDPGLVWVPMTDEWMKAMANCKGVPIEKDEVDKILRNAPRKWARANAIIMNSTDEKDFAKAIELYKSKCEDNG